MNPETEKLLRAALDFVWESSIRDSEGNPRSDKEKLHKLGTYVGWLEGTLLRVCTDEQAQTVIDSIQVMEVNYAADEADVHDDEDGSFY